MGGTWTFSSAKVESRDLKLDDGDGLVVYPNETFILVRPGSTITYSGTTDNPIGSIDELYAKSGDSYYALGGGQDLYDDEEEGVSSTLNVDELFTNCSFDEEEIVAMALITIWTSDSTDIEELYNGIKYYYIVLADSSSTQPQQPAGPQVSDWAKDQVARAKASGLVPDGLGDDYRVNATRAQFAAIAVQLYLAKTGYGEPYVEDMESPFTDTNDPAVLQASVLNLVNGMGDGTFAPNALVTREQAAVMLSQVHLRTGGSVGGGEPAFADKDNISSWAKYYVSFMNDNGIISGVGDNRFDPQGNASIEQALSISLRMLENLK